MAKTPAKASKTKAAPKKAAPSKATASKAAVKAPVAAPAPVAKAKKVDPVVVGGAADTEDMRKPQLLDAVAKRSGVKRKDAKLVLEAALGVLGEAIAEGQEINVKPLGKLKVVRSKQMTNGRVINLRLRQSEAVIKELDEQKKDAAE